MTEPHEYDPQQTALSKKTSQPDFQYILKLIIIGDSGVGKSSIMLRYNQNKFVQNYMMTIGINYVAKTIEIEGTKIKLQIWDTAGQQKYKTITQNYYRHSHGAIVAFSIDSRESFHSVKNWIDELAEAVTKSIQIMLVGTKKDLEKERQVSYEEAQEFASNFGVSYMQCSAKSGDSVDEVFMTIGKMMKKKNDEKIEEPDEGDNHVNLNSSGQRRFGRCCGGGLFRY